MGSRRWAASGKVRLPLQQASAGKTLASRVNGRPQARSWRPAPSGRSSSGTTFEALTKYRRETVIAVGLKITAVAWVGILTVFAMTYLTQQLGMPRSVILSAITLAGLIEVLVMPLAGWPSDVIGRRTIYLAGTGFGILLAFPIFWLFETRDVTIVTRAIVVGICLCQGVVFALHASFMPELFGTDARYSGVSLGFQLGAAIGGGLTPVVAAAIVARTGATWAVSLILVALGVLTIVAVLSTRETAARPMRA